MISQERVARGAEEVGAGDAGTHQAWRPHILFFAPQILDATSRSGVHRVVTQVAQALLSVADIDFVKWDAVDGQLRYFNADDFDILFRDWPWRRRISVNRFAERRRYRFGDTLSVKRRAETWLLMPEISYLVVNGSNIYARVMAQAHAYRLKTAALFYDLIPITNPDYRDAAQAHTDYVLSLLDVDLVVPISVHSAKELIRFESEILGLDSVHRQRLGRDITAVPLATINEGVSRPQPMNSSDSKDLVVLLGTIEPRKRQVEVLRALKRTRILDRFNLRVKIIGSLHPAVAASFNEFVVGNPNIEYVGYANEEEINAIFERARFSVFTSNDEGFGLPICESLARGTPCLTANFGSMLEVGEGGGCLLVDVNDEAQIERGLERLASDDDLVARLRDEIAHRRFRTWSNYAQDLLRTMHDFSLRERRAFGNVIREAIARRPSNGAEDHITEVISVGEEAWAIVYVRHLDAKNLAGLAADLARRNVPRRAIVFDLTDLDATAFADSDITVLLTADAWIFRASNVYDTLVKEAEARSFGALLPTRCGFTNADRALEDVVVETIAGLADDLFRRRRQAERETAMRQARKHANSVIKRPLLDLIISTYNRGSFVAENVRWLLPQVATMGGSVRLLVVDNASTDDTQIRLSALSGSPYFEIFRNATNTGMLGNLHVCSTLTRARHAWIIGDDDFITPGTLAAVVRALENDSGLPFIFINFGVYLRESLGPHDTVGALIRDPVRLAVAPCETNVYPVKKIAEEHDNLFTAIYPIVFRSDVLSACFNYPFTGTPFGSLVESVPTTKIILDDYADVEALWISDVGIVGNAHNSWQRYRVAWHGVLMPLVFELAKEAGVDPYKLYNWSQIHEGLYDEAKGMFPDQTLEDLFDDEREVSRRIFRHSLR